MESKLPEDELPVQLLESISNEADEVTDEKASGRVTAYKYGYRDGYFIGATAYAPWKVKYDELCERYKALDQAMFQLQQQLKAQPGARWVKAEKVRDNFGITYHAKDEESKGAGLFDIDGHFKWEDGSITFKHCQEDLYILIDESAEGREDIDVDELWDEHAEYIDDNIDELIRWAGCTVVTREQFNKMMAKFKEKEK